MPTHPIVAALRGRLGTDVPLATDADVLAAYSHDRAPWLAHGAPLAMVAPGDVDGVRHVLELAAEHRVPVVPRGAGSGLTGAANAVDGCLVLSTHRLRPEPRLDVDDRLVRVGAGTLNGEVKQAAAGVGLLYPPDPASSAFCSIGGNVATNAGGLCCVRYGVTRDWVRELDVVLPGGEALRVGHTAPKSVAGLDLVSLLVGSEGTLGVVTGATLALTRGPDRLVTVVASLPSLAAAGDVVLALRDRPEPPVLLEIMDATTIRAVEELAHLGLDVEAAALVLVQLPEEADGAGAAGPAGVEDVCRAAGATEVYATTEPDEARALLQARRLAYEAFERRGLPLLEDVAVDVSRLPALIAAIAGVAERRGVTIGTFGHAADGNLHPVILVEHDTPAARVLAQSAFDDVVEETLALGGTLSGEHGIGRLKLPYLARQLDPVALRLMQQVRAAFDPLGLMNPGSSLPA
ncbi:FAD-binding protein [Nocardioides sp. TRM66260-LWL]|uniref:FAD-binding oxidoreductase n=1 Tax=Nocardioides sp. TRM66260-LWL TaxID=2874478 RepID=UPI001CC46DD0|nr:FAD-linked oxidase C-terminal domain-containing protein [Nocardioides sp. TRM66260-LWL]MBZ5734609.1 FAD-binding protein [Nocardioides sp. TRM66260-LWL]